MKKVAGKLRLDLAQYRELAAFAQFSSDLDKATQAQISRGQRLTELLKQLAMRPMTVGAQVVILYAGTQSLLDSVPVNRITAFKNEFLAYLRGQRPEIEAEINATLAVSEETEKKIKEAVSTFLSTFFGVKSFA